MGLISHPATRRVSPPPTLAHRPFRLILVSPVPYLHLGPIDYAILGVYFAFVLGIGWVVRRHVKQSEDFFLAVVDFDPASKKLKLTHIFDWYKEDFGKADDKVIGWINNFRAADAKLPTDAKIEYANYDWTLNDVNTLKR